MIAFQSACRSVAFAAFMRVGAAVWGVMLTGLALSGCAAAVVAGAGAAGVAALQDKTLGESVDDTSIWNEIRSRFLAARGMALNSVDVEVSQRFVLLSGTVLSEADRTEAGRIAQSVARVAGVGNEILIGSPRGARQAAADELITAGVRARLAASGGVRAINYNIETHQGVVYLLGVARDEAELERAVEEARVVRGVQKVISYVRVVPLRPPASAPASTPAGAADAPPDAAFAGTAAGEAFGPAQPLGSPLANPSPGPVSPAPGR
jgi:osmotically-inducible protein OsmY